MAADDEKNEAPDPWANLMGDDTAAGEDLPADEPDETPAAAETQPEDADVSEWLTTQDGEPAAAAADPPAQVDAVPPLSVFAPEEAAVEQFSQSSIEIGTGLSGIDMTDGEGGSSADTTADGLGEWDAVDVESQAASTEVEAVATTVAPAVRAAKSPAKGGGLGPMVGVVAGGVLAIPITMAILLWGFQRDPFGIAKQVPPSMAFLLPQKFRRGAVRRPSVPAGRPAAPSLDALAASAPQLDPPATGESDKTPAPEPEDAKPEAKPDPEPTVPDPPVPEVDPPAVVDEPTSKPNPKRDPTPDPTPDAADPEPDDPLFPDPDAPASPKPAPPADETAEIPPPAAVAAVEPSPPAQPPLDLAALEAAVAAASAALEAAAAEENLAGNAGKKLLVDWYRAVARAADELVRVQREAADTGRPLDETPVAIAELHDGIAAEELVAAALPKLARSWLAYARRDSAGILLPVTFDSAKRVGPYWRAKVRLEDGEHSRDLAIITREEPEAIAGDRLIVTGIVLEGDVIWAADVRSPAAEPATVDF